MSDRPNPLIYGEFDRLVPIRVLGREFQVPEGIPLIRAFQFIQFELSAMKSDWSLFCFNDTIGCCSFRYRNGDGEEIDARACCLRVEEGLEVVGLPNGSSLLIEPT
ncbi:MAG: hypothetical protein H6706_26715 [Myxococcales bacterium]|nr:hypothetical protein [Myxococcales bacterium]